MTQENTEVTQTQLDDRSIALAQELLTKLNALDTEHMTGTPDDPVADDAEPFDALSGDLSEAVEELHTPSGIWSASLVLVGLAAFISIVAAFTETQRDVQLSVPSFPTATR